MRTFAQKPQATQQTESAESMHPARVLSGQSREVRSILRSQRAIGNQAAQRMMAATTEQTEADSATTKASTRFGHDFGRIPIFPQAPPNAQPKLTVNTSGEILEQEADETAEQVMSMPGPVALKQIEIEEEKEEEQTIQATPLIRRQIEEDQEPVREKSMVQRQPEEEGEEPLQTKGETNHIPSVNSQLECRIHALRGSGRPLSTSERDFFEPRFGHDFSGIPVHASPGGNIQPNPEVDAPRNVVGKARGAHELARRGQSGSARPLPYLEAIQLSFGRHALTGARAFVGGPAGEANERMRSLAFTSGDRVAFKQSPDLHTAAHEAAHIVQQRAGVQLPGGMGKPGDRHEQHADAVADAVVRGESAESLLDRYGTMRWADSVQVQCEDGSGSTTASEEEVCEALRAALDNSRRVIALEREFLAGSVDWDAMQSQLRQIGNAAQGVTGAGHDLPQVVQDAIEEVESFGLEELIHLGRLAAGLPSLAFGSGEFFRRQWATNEIERQEHLNLVIIESMYSHGCPDFPGTWRGFQEQVLTIGTRGSEQRSPIESPRETRTAVAWVETGGEEVLVLATEVEHSGRLRFVRWIHREFRDLALQQARDKQGSIPSVPGTAVSGLPSSVPSSATRR